MSNKTVLDLMTKGLDQATMFNSKKVTNNYPYAAIIINVPVTLEPIHDFDINGELLATGDFETIQREYGSMKLSDLGDYRIKHAKMVWSKEPINLKDPATIFNTGVILRVTSSDEEVTKFISLRNAYGESLVDYTLM